MSEEEIFTEALLRPEGAERLAFLEEVCGGDLSLRRRIDELLAMHQATNPILDRSPAELIEGFHHSHRDAKARRSNPDVGLSTLLLPSDRPGSLGRLAHYDVLTVLGRGGFGIVTRAFDNTLQRIVALKVLTPELAATSPPRKRFLREARAVAQVKNEHVIQVYAVEEQPTPFLVMEFVAGPNLQEKLDQEGPLDAAEVVRLGRQLALGLAAAHEQGLIHRDVKPANILLEGDREPKAKLTDFGLARAVDDASMTASGVISGTPMFMAPEQVKGERLDTRADLFSLGSVMYTMLAGRPPFRAALPFAVMKRVAEDTPRPLSDVIGPIPPGLEAVVNRLLAKNPADRFASARDVVDALDRCLTTPTPFPNAPRRSRRWLTVAGLSMVLLTVGITLGYALSRRPHPAPSPPGPPAEPVDPWAASVAALPAREQFPLVLQELKRLNPHFDGLDVHYQLQDDVVAELWLNKADGLRDLSPLRALTGLRKLCISAQAEGPADLRPLRGLQLIEFEAIFCPIREITPLEGMPIEKLTLWNYSPENNIMHAFHKLNLNNLTFGGGPIRDLSVLQGLRLTYLCVNHTEVDDLSPLVGMPLKTLLIEHTRVQDLSPLAEMRLEEIHMNGSPIANLGPLRKHPLKKIGLDNPAQHTALLSTIPTLTQINGRPVSEILGKREP